MQPAVSGAFALFRDVQIQNREVLFAYEAADETVFLSLPQYRMKQLKSVENWAKAEGTNEPSTESMRSSAFLIISC